MLESRGEFDLLLEALRANARGDFIVQNFERDGAVVAEVVREVDDGESTAAEFAFEPVAVGECSRELRLSGQWRGRL
jgi:uncharacterized protein YkuJ